MEMESDRPRTWKIVDKSLFFHKTKTKTKNMWK